MNRADKERNRSLLIKHTHVHNTRPFSKTHPLKDGANKERNRLFLVKHTRTQNTRPFSETHLLMLAMEGADKKRNRLLLVKRAHTQHKTINKTHWLCWKWREQTSRETGYIWSNIHTYTT